MTYARRRPGPNQRDKWETRIAKDKSLTPATRLFLTSVLAKHMKANGEVSRPQEQLANEMGCNVRTVSRHITKAHEAGWLRTISPGCLGHTAVYGIEWGKVQMHDKNVSHQEPDRDPRCTTPSVVHLDDTDVVQYPEMHDKNVAPVVSNYNADVYRTSGDVADGHDRDAGHGSKSPQRLAQVRPFRRDSA